MSSNPPFFEPADEGESVSEGESVFEGESDRTYIEDFSEAEVNKATGPGVTKKEARAGGRKAPARPSYPHANSDKPSSVDTLHRQHYVRALAALVTHPKTQVPLTLGIYGPWGSGKSSFMIQLREMISPKINCIEFNPWRCEDTSSLWYGLVTEIALALDRKFTFRDRLRFLVFHWPKGQTDVVKKMRARALAGAKKFHNWITGVLTFFGLTQADTLAAPFHHLAKKAWVAEGLATLGLVDGPVTPESLFVGMAALLLLVWGLYKMRRVLTNPFLTQIEAYRQSSGEGQAEFKQLTFAELDVIRDLFRNTVKGDSSGTLRIAIFLDDLDRCSPDRVVEVLEAVHLCLDGLPFVTVLGMDSRVVSQAIATRYSFLLDAAATPIEKEAYGQYFLQKIVHIPFQLPPPWVYGKYIKRLMGVKDGATGNPAEDDGEPGLVDFKTEELQEKMEVLEQELQKLNPLILDLKASPRSVKCLINQYRLSKAINSQLEADRQIDTEQLFYWLVLFQNWPKWGSVFFGQVEKNPGLMETVETLRKTLGHFPATMRRYIENNHAPLREVVTGPGGLEFTRCFSFLAPEGPFSAPSPAEKEVK